MPGLERRWRDLLWNNGTIESRRDGSGAVDSTCRDGNARFRALRIGRGIIQLGPNLGNGPAISKLSNAARSRPRVLARTALISTADGLGHPLLFNQLYASYVPIRHDAASRPQRRAARRRPRDHR